MTVRDKGYGPVSDPNLEYTGKLKLTGHLDARQSVTGHVAAEVLGPSPSAPEAVPLYVEAQIRILVNSVVLGTVSVAGPSLPGAPPHADFHFPVPAQLRGQAVRVVRFSVVFDTCLGAPACALTLTGADAAVLHLPLS